jgi:hypothetical protein
MLKTHLPALPADLPGALQVSVSSAPHLWFGLSHGDVRSKSHGHKHHHHSHAHHHHHAHHGSAHGSAHSGVGHHAHGARVVMSLASAAAVLPCSASDALLLPLPLPLRPETPPREPTAPAATPAANANANAANANANADGGSDEHEHEHSHGFLLSGTHCSGTRWGGDWRGGDAWAFPLAPPAARGTVMGVSLDGCGAVLEIPAAPLELEVEEACTLDVPPAPAHALEEEQWDPRVQTQVWQPRIKAAASRDLYESAAGTAALFAVDWARLAAKPSIKKVRGVSV